MALAGGNTPRKLYAALTQAPGIPWQQTWLFWGDERYVPPDHPESNYGMVRRILLDTVGVPASQVFPMPTHSGDPLRDAAEYEATLQQIFGTECPAFDLIWLGVGEDGHTASLFPGTAALQVQHRWVTVGQKGEEPRLTLTYPVLNRAAQVVVLVTGASKAAIVKEALTTEAHLPCQRLNPQGRLLWLLDAAAAAELPLAAVALLG